VAKTAKISDKAIAEIKAIREWDEERLKKHKRAAKELALAFLGMQCKILWENAKGINGIAGEITQVDDTFVTISTAVDTREMYLGYIVDILGLE